ncbi:MAG: outer membrane protein assembly factor BamA [Thermodesulfobacteriota bacterium]
MILPILLFLPAILVYDSWCYSSFKENNKGAAVFFDSLVSRIDINLGDFPGNTKELIRLARDLIVLKQGEPFSPDLLQESIQALKRSRRFQEIHVDSRQEDRGMALLFNLKPFQLIKDIKIYGEFPLFETEILRAMTVHVGDIFTREESSKQAAIIAEVFKGEGFAEPEISLTVKDDNQDGNVALQVNIEKGPYRTVAQITLEGNEAFSDSLLKCKMKVWRSTLLPGSWGRFIRRNLTEDIENLVGYYRKNGYADVMIDQKILKQGEQDLAISILIHEGPRYIFEFAGNRSLKKSILRKDLVLLKEGNKKDLGLKKSIREMIERYRKAGFLETQIRIAENVDEATEKSVRRVRFIIDEGPRALVTSIRFIGNQAFDDETLKNQMLTRVPGFGESGVYLPETLDQDLDAIQLLYRQHGYMDAEIKDVLKWSGDKHSVEISLMIEEGVQSLISSITIVGLTVVTQEEARGRFEMKTGEPFRRYMVQSDENNLSALISEKGYPHVTVKGEVSIGKDKSTIHITHHVDEGPYITMGHVYCVGTFKTKNRIIRREFQMNPGEPFSLTKMLRSQRNIRSLGIFDSVVFRLIGLEEKRDQVHVLVEVEEEKPYFIEVGGGYETERGFYLHARTGDRNLAGTAKDAWIAGEVSQIGYRGELGITEPRLLGTRISATLGMYAEREEEFNQDFGTKSLGASLGFSRKWFGRTTTGLNFRFERRETYRQDSLESSADLDEEFQRRGIFIISPSVVYDTRDSFIRPRKGILSSFSVDLYRGTNSSFDDFLKYRYDIRYYVTPLPRLTLAWRGRAGYIDPYGQTERISDDHLFYLGGASSIRGFDENLFSFDVQGDPVGGRFAGELSIESRIDLGRNFELAFFYDVGRLDDTYVSAVSDKTRSSVGTGLRYITPIGAVGLLYGMKLDPEEGESPGRIHFSVGYTF